MDIFTFSVSKEVFHKNVNCQVQDVIIRNFGNVSLFIIFIIIFYKRGVFGKFRHRSNQQSHSFLEIEENSLPQVHDDFFSEDICDFYIPF